MEDISNLLWALSPPPAFNISVEDTTGTRRRLFGGDYPGEFVGDSFRIFGGHDYGYVIPPTAYNGDISKIRDFTRKNAYLGLAFTVALAVGNSFVIGAWKSAKLFAFLVFLNELFSWAVSKGTSKVTFQQLVDTYTKLEKGAGLGLDAGTPALQLATERWHGIKAGETRFLSGSSMLYGALAGYGLYITGIFPIAGFLTGKGALSYYVSNFIFFNNINLYLKEKRSGVTTGTAHREHARSMIVGFMLAWNNFP